MKQFIESGIKFIYDLDQFPKERVYQQVSNELNEILSLNQEAVLKKRVEYVGIGCKEDYRSKLIETKEGPVLAGIRHLGGNLEEPFVFLWLGFKVQDIKGIIEVIKPHFEQFKPKYYNFWVRPEYQNLQLRHLSILQQRFIGTIADMKKYDLNLVRPTEYYDWYQQEYALFHQAYPEYRDRIACNDQELMDHCLEEGLLFLLKSEQNQNIGLIAGEQALFLGEPSIYLDEILIAQEARGQGVAPKLFGSFLSMLDPKAHYITSYVDIDNISSTKTALRAGQRVFSVELSYKID